MRVAIVSYFAPPQKAVASHRVLRMSRMLLMAGHEVHWVTADTASFAEPGRSLDHSFAKWTPRAIKQHPLGREALVTVPVARTFWEKVKRSAAFEVSRRMAYTDGFFDWGRTLRKKLVALVQEHGIEAVVLCCSPHSQIGVVPRLRAALPNLRIYVDYRDLLSGNPWNVHGSESRRRRLLSWERRMLEGASAVFVNTTQAREQFETTLLGPGVGLDPKNVEVMRNAADYALSEQIFELAGPMNLGKGRHIGFFGSLFPRRRLSGFLEAMAKLSPEDLEQLTLHVYCDANDSARLLAEDLEGVDAAVAARVQRHEFLDWTEALRTMQAMDALLLVNGSTQEDAVFVPGKLYDYLMARRPILFLGYPGDASSLVKEACGEARCFGDSDARLTETLRDLCRGRPGDVAPLASCSPENAFGPLLDKLREGPDSAPQK